MTTVGFGDISAFTDIERGFATLCMVIGVSWYAFVISTFSSILAMFDRHEAKKRETMSQIIQLLKDTRVPKTLRNQILNHVEYTNEQRGAPSEKDLNLLKGLLSTQLRTELVLFLNKRLIGDIELFNSKTPQLIVQCVEKLKPMTVKEGDSVITFGQHPKDLYFLRKGKAVFLLNVEETLRVSVSEGTFFGEIGCIFEQTATECVKAVIDCELLRLGKNQVWQLMNEFPEFSEELKRVAKLRLEKFKKLRKNSLNEMNLKKKTVNIQDIIVRMKQAKNMKAKLLFDEENNPLVLRKGKVVKSQNNRSSVTKKSSTSDDCSKCTEIKSELSSIKLMLQELIQRKK